MVLKYIASEPVTKESELFIEWYKVINQWEETSARMVGQIMQTIEMMGLPDKQESAIKSAIKSSIYDSANDALDWNALHLLQLRNGKMVQAERDGFEQK